MRHLLAALAIPCLLVGQPASADTLERVKSTGTFKIGYRTDAPPFSFESELGEAAGYSVSLCRVLATNVKAALGMDEIDVQYVPVGAKDRFDAVIDERVDILCGATTMTLERRRLVDFSISTFIDGASVAYRADGPKSFDELNGKKIGVLADTTTEEALRATLNELSLDAKVVPVKKHDDGFKRLESGDISAYFADQAILLFLLAKNESKVEMILSDRQFTVEPYALAISKGDSDFRLFVDRILSRLYRSGDIVKVFKAAFGADVTPTPTLGMLYMISALPE